MTSECGEGRFKNYTQSTPERGKDNLKLVLELESHGHHSQAGMTMNGIMPRPAMKRLMEAFLRVPSGLWPTRQ
jgi:hypothetical protein